MRPPKFPLNRETRHSTTRGVVLFFHHGSWCLCYRRNRKKFEESLGTRDDKLAWAELEKASKLYTEGATPQELLGVRHHTTATVADAAKEFLVDYTAISLGTQRKLRGTLCQWLIGENFDPQTGTWTKRDDAALARPFSALEIHTVEMEHVKAHVEKVRATVNQFGRRNSRAFARIVLDAVRLLFQWLIEKGRLKSKDGRVLANPAAKCGKFTFNAELDTKYVQDASGAAEMIADVKVFEPAQEAAILDWFRTYCRRLYPMLLIGFGTGARFGEATALEITDYDPARHRLHVRKHWTPEGVVIGTKSNRVAKGVIKTRDVPSDLHPDLEPALDAHITWLRATNPKGWDGRRLFPASSYTRPDGSTNLGAYITPTNFYRAIWNKACGELGIKDLTFHNARHTFASKCLHHGATPQEVSSWLGDTLEVFLRHYAHPIKDAERERSRAGLLAPAKKLVSAKPSLRVVRRG